MRNRLFRWTTGAVLLAVLLGAGLAYADPPVSAGTASPFAMDLWRDAAPASMRPVTEAAPLSLTAARGATARAVSHRDGPLRNADAGRQADRPGDGRPRAALAGYARGVGGDHHRGGEGLNAPGPVQIK